jgi:hypothetical protein
LLDDISVVFSSFFNSVVVEAARVVLDFVFADSTGVDLTAATDVLLTHLFPDFVDVATDSNLLSFEGLTGVELPIDLLHF